MVLRFLGLGAALATLVLGCTSIDRNNPIDENGNNYGGGLVTISSSSDGTSSSSGIATNDCEDIFNPVTHFCYNSEVYVLCNSMSYNPTAYFCDGSIVRIAKCNGVEYNPLIQGCCSNSTFVLSNQRCQSDVILTKCGTGTSYHNPETQFCDGNNVVNKCNGEEFDPATQRCQNDIVETRCGTGIYYHNPATQFCDGNNVVNKCNGEEFDPATQRCGVGDIVETQCGVGWYNSEIQDCCNNNAIFALSNQRCENNIVETRCGTGNIFHNPTTEECCGNTKFTILPNQRCEANVVETKCGDDWYDAMNTNLKCEEDIVKAECGNNNWYNFFTHFCAVDNLIYAKCGGVTEYNPSSQYCSGDNNVIDKEEFTDSRGGQKYKYVTIGAQVWMAENLNYEVEGSECRVDWQGISYCDVYGRFYDWETAKEVCPNGWHLPSDDEWNTLINFIEEENDCTNCAGKYLKAMSRWFDYSVCGDPVSTGKDTYGFAALPGHSPSPNYRGSCSDVGYSGFWWSASENDASDAFLWVMTYSSSGAWHGNPYNNKMDLLSVRCLQD